MPEKKRGQCPVCKREFLLKKDGNLRHHGGVAEGPWNYRAYRCEGAGQKPAPCAPKAGVDYCGATHPEYGECFLDVDEVEHEHGHESESGRWSVTVSAVSTDEER